MSSSSDVISRLEELWNTQFRHNQNVATKTVDEVMLELLGLMISEQRERLSRGDLLAALRIARRKIAFVLRPDDPRHDDAYCAVDDAIKRAERLAPGS